MTTGTSADWATTELTEPKRIPVHPPAAVASHHHKLGILGALDEPPHRHVTHQSPPHPHIGQL
ncbi:MAG: hypothetical protein JOZ49_02240 [Mycolicibacterium sp.]|nr:hypothetical protein [Mycolicibacterium sp.]